MKIVSKRGQKPHLHEKVLPDVDFQSYGIIISDPSVASPEDIKRAEQAIKELKDQLDQLKDVVDDGWYGKAHPAP